MSIYTEEEFQSKQYRWRKDNGNILVTIVSQPFRLGHADKETKITETDPQDGSNKDIDALHLKKFFEEEKEKFPVAVDCKFRQNIDFDAYIKDYIEIMEDKDKKFDKYEKYDCFVFVFLTYIDDEKLHFHDKCIPLEEILNKVKAQEVTRGKPKIFLVQSDDNTLLGVKTLPKGPVEVIERKIPQDADRFIIQSTVPQGIANRNTSSGTKNPSFLIQAFTQALSENWEREEHKREDFLSLSTEINGKVDDMIRSSGDNRAGDMQVPLVTSTLTKQLLF
ncbi:uncharacterized protein LOC123540593 isoform X2 [Mercenaria mercenaria]|nr:uncharacterized protein LOC123540593 isoform X2 [Mercenaria mercenaria]